MKNLTLALSRYLLVACALAALLLRTAAFAQSPLTVSDPWMRQAMAAAQQTAIFMVIENKSAEKRQLVSASATVAEKVELHTMSMDGGMMKMTQVKAIDVPANGKAELKPGSFHIMLFGLKSRPEDGATVDVTLTFDNGQTMPVKAVVRKPEGMR